MCRCVALVVHGSQQVQAGSWLRGPYALLLAGGSSSKVPPLCCLPFLQGGRLNAKESKLLRVKPDHRAMPISWNVCVMMLRYWQAELLEALVAVK